MRVGSAVRSAELEELRRFEATGIKRPGQRLLLWTGECGTLLSGTETSLDPPDSGGMIAFDRHYWVVRVECEFSNAPGAYRIEYLSDPWGEFATGSDAGWILLAAGAATSMPRLVGKKTFYQAEDEQKAWHDQPALFMKAVRVITENAVSVTGWRIYEDMSLNLSDYLEGDVAITRRMEAREEGRFVRSECEFGLADPDGRFLEYGAPPSDPQQAGGDFRDSTGLTYLRCHSRWTLEVTYAGPEWERPIGFEGTGYWPVYCGYLRRRTWDRSEKTQLNVFLRAGKKVTDEKTTQPLHEQMTADEFLRDWVTVSDDGQRRLMGAQPSGGVTQIATSYEEFVAKTRVFGDNWWQSVLTLDASTERIIGLCSTGMHLVALIYEVAAEHWWLVRYDFGGKEVERKDLGASREYASQYRYMMDVTCGNGKILIVEQTRSREAGVAYHAWGFIGEIDAENWDGDVRWEPSGSAHGIINLALSGICFLRGGVLDGYYCVLQTHKFDDVTIGAKVLVFNPMGTNVGEWQYRMASGGYNDPAPRTMEMIYCEDDHRYLLAVCGGWIDSDFGGNHLNSTMIQIDVPSYNIQFLHLSVGDISPMSVVVSLGEAQATVSCSYSGIVKVGDYLLAAGFGPQSVQEVARVARLGYYLENARLRSETTPPSSPVNGGVRTVNFAEPRVRIGGEVIDSSRYALDLDTGHLGLLFLPEDGQAVRVSYDYEPSWGLVQIDKENRWDLAGEVAWGNGLELSIDAFDRLVWRERTIEEVFVAGTGRTWLLGATRDVDGLPWVVPETIEIVYSGGSGAAVAPDLYMLASESYATEDGQAVLRWRLSVVGGLAEEKWVIRFAVQQTVTELDSSHLQFTGETDAERIITKVVCKGARRVPSDFPLRIEQVFAVAPSSSEILSSFERLKPVEGTKVYDWRPTENIYEQSEPEEQPVFHVTFDQPLLLGTSRWGVEYGKLPLYYTFAPKPDVWEGKRFLKVNFGATLPNDQYCVWIQHPGAVCLAKSSDFEDMLGNVTGTGSTVPGEGNNPANADDIKTKTHCYLRMMNALLAGECRVMVYAKEIRYYEQDADGRIISTSNSLVNGGEQRFKTSFPEKAVLVILRPQDDNDQALFMDNPLVNDDPGTGDKARLVIERLQLAGEGLKIDFANFALRQNWLVIEVIGYPVSEAENYNGTAKSAEAIELYGEQEKPFENRFFPNQAVAARLAERALARRAVEPVKYSASRPLCLLIEEGELVRIAVPQPYDAQGMPVYAARLLRAVEATGRLSGGGSTTELKVE